MALDSKKFLVRAGSAAVFVVVLLGSIFYGYSTFSLLFLVVMLGGLNEFYKLAVKLDAKPFAVTGMILAVAIYAAMIRWEIFAGFEWKHAFLPMVLTPFVILSVAMFSYREHPVKDAVFTLTGVLYVSIPFALMHRVVVPSAELPVYVPNLLLAVILLIWCNDTFAYIGGSFFGKHKMIARISPGKTWEGTIIGALLAFLSGFLLNKWLLNGNGGVEWLVMSALVPVLATVGDLTESMLKRQAGVKDSGQIMPGHGGFLDRFDSLILTAPFIYVIGELL